MPFDAALAGTSPGLDACMTAHLPVMLDEAITGLDLRAGGTYVDCTFGRGGHARAILEKLDGSGALHALDQDAQAVAHAREAFALHRNFTIHHANFARLADVASAAGIAGRINGVLMDLGVSSPQLDDPGRGFSFSADGPLDMRMDRTAGEPAAAWLARADEAEIADVLWSFGDERNSRRIAKRIVQTRATAPLATTAQLAALIAAVPGPRSRKIHPATRSFQAIRIFINGELDALQTGLAQARELLAPGGRLVVISFHSLEDRIVKRFMREQSRDPGPGTGDPETPGVHRMGTDRQSIRGGGRSAMAFARVPGPGSRVPAMQAIARLFPSDTECARNPRARSAVLRIAGKAA